MKPGTIVVVLKFNVQETLKGCVKWLPVADEKTPYMIRDIAPDDFGLLGVSFEEGVMGYNMLGRELRLHISKVREILPPGEISEEIKEVLNQELLVPLNQ